MAGPYQKLAGQPISGLAKPSTDDSTGVMPVDARPGSDKQGVSYTPNVKPNGKPNGLVRAAMINAKQKDGRKAPR